MNARGEYACRDCRRCNTSAFGSAAYKTKTRVTGVLTLGLSHLLRAARTKCGRCGHLMADHVSEDEDDATESAVETRRSVPAAPPRSTGMHPPATEQNAVEKIRQLARLHEAGILTDEEFKAAKAKVLGI